MDVTKNLLLENKDALKFVHSHLLLRRQLTAILLFSRSAKKEEREEHLARIEKELRQRTEAYRRMEEEGGDPKEKAEFVAATSLLVRWSPRTHSSHAPLLCILFCFFFPFSLSIRIQHRISKLKKEQTYMQEKIKSCDKKLNVCSFFSLSLSLEYEKVIKKI